VRPKLRERNFGGSVSTAVARGEVELGHGTVISKVSPDTLAQHASAFAVNDAHLDLTSGESSVQVVVEEFNRFVESQAT
jgi:hypothetical protein